MERRVSNRFQALCLSQPRFRLRACQEHERKSPITVILNVEYITGTGFRQHDTFLAIGSCYHGGIIPPATRPVNWNLIGRTDHAKYLLDQWATVFKEDYKGPERLSVKLETFYSRP
jgi:hypothetical protein